MLSAIANILPIHLYILVFQNLHILISTNDLSIVTNALYLLPMFYHALLNTQPYFLHSRGQF